MPPTPSRRPRPARKQNRSQNPNQARGNAQSPNQAQAHAQNPNRRQPGQGQGQPGQGQPGQGQPGQAQQGQAQQGQGQRQPGRPGRAKNAGRRATRADPVRRAAYDVLSAVDQRDAYANLLLPALLRERAITGRDAALATELTYGTLRGLQTYDAILNLCSDRSPGDIDPPVREVLRLGTHQLLATRVASHAAVATSVDLAKDVAGMRPAGFVNAVLRRVGTRTQAEWLEIIAPDRAADPIGYLAATCSYPRWIVEAFRAALGEVPGQDPAGGLPETAAALAAGNVRPRITLAALPGLAEPKELIGAGAAEPAEPSRWSPFGVVLPGGDPAAIPAVAEGRAFVQDEASQLAALALAHAPLAAPLTGVPGTPEPSGPPEAVTRPWLDLCAGPGGKSAVLAALAAPAGTHLLASDVRPHRAELTRAHLRHLPNTAVIAADGRAGAWRPGSFDRVLADVPCSGLGALRRRPEARWRKSPEDVEELGSLQRALLHAAIDAARPGGVIAYVTCSPHLAETHDVLRDVLASRTDVTVLDAPAILTTAIQAPGVADPGPIDLAPIDPAPIDLAPIDLAPIDPGPIDLAPIDPGPTDPGPADPGIPALPRPAADGRYAQFWPHRHGTDAIFLALLRREPEAPGPRVSG